MRMVLILVSLLALAACERQAGDETMGAKGELQVRAERNIPAGMVYIPGGSSAFGNEYGALMERPQSQIDVSAFFMDARPVTVEQFAAFVEATGYETEAEKFGNAGVFSEESGEWTMVDSAYWRRPRGHVFAAANDDHPVTQVSWNDANAYCKWAGKRLPTEREWEYAAREGGQGSTPYHWGKSLKKDGKYMANTWTGNFPFFNDRADGFFLTSPVGHFGANDLGLADMLGNVWEWCSDAYLPYGDANPAGQMPGATRNQKDTLHKVMRGGSFLCDTKICHGYRVTARSGSSPETSLFHVGFRAVRDL